MSRNIEMYVDDDYFQSEREIIDDIMESFDEMDNFFDNGDWENEF